MQARIQALIPAHLQALIPAHPAYLLRSFPCRFNDVKQRVTQGGALVESRGVPIFIQTFVGEGGGGEG